MPFTVRYLWLGVKIEVTPLSQQLDRSLFLQHKDELTMYTHEHELDLDFQLKRAADVIRTTEDPEMPRQSFEFLLVVAADNLDILRPGLIDLVEKVRGMPEREATPMIEPESWRTLV